MQTNITWDIVEGKPCHNSKSVKKVIGKMRSKVLLNHHAIKGCVVHVTPPIDHVNTTQPHTDTWVPVMWS